MKTKRNISTWAAALLMLAGFTFTSCSDDENDKPGTSEPGFTFEKYINFDARKYDDESGREGKMGINVRFKVMEGEFKGMPIVSITEFCPIAAYFYLKFDFDLKYDHEWYLVNTLGDGCIRDRRSILSVDFGPYLEHVGRGVFSGANLLEKLTMGSSVKTIGDYAFESCTKLPSLEWDFYENEISIGSNAFAKRTAMKVANINFRQASIGTEAFRDCTSLETATISAENLEIGREVFEDCTSLETATISGDTLYVGEDVFEGCTNLKKATFSSWQESLVSGVFHELPSLENVEFGNGLKVVKRGAFSNCASLKVVDLPSTIEAVEPYAFVDCPSLERINIHGSQNLISSEGLGLPEGARVVNVAD